MKNLFHSLGRRQRADKEECLLRGSAGEKQVFLLFPLKTVGEGIISLARMEDQCIYTIHL